MTKQKPTNPYQNLTPCQTPHIRPLAQNYPPLQSVLHDTIKIQIPQKFNPQIQTQLDNQNHNQFHKTNKPQKRKKNSRKQDLGQPKCIKIHDPALKQI